MAGWCNRIVGGFEQEAGRRSCGFIAVSVGLVTPLSVVFGARAAPGPRKQLVTTLYFPNKKKGTLTTHMGY